MEDLDRIRRLAGILNEAHVPAAGPNPAASLNAHDCECEEDDCPRCNPATEANNGELDECIEEAYRRFMAESDPTVMKAYMDDMGRRAAKLRKKKPEPKWVDCEDCGGSGRSHYDHIDGFGTSYTTSGECFNCSGEGGWHVDPDEDEEEEEEDELHEQGEEEDVPASEAEQGLGLIEDDSNNAYGKAADLVDQAIDLVHGANPEESVLHVLNDAHSQLCYLADSGVVTEASATRQSGGNVTLTMSVAEANIVAQALNHVGREVYDNEGDGLTLIDLANKIKRCL